MNSIVKHHFSIDPPLPSEIAVGEVALQITLNWAKLYTKSFDGKIIEIGKGVSKLSQLEDIDLTNAKEGSFLIRQGDKWTASNFIGAISSLADVEVNNPQAGQYLRYDATSESFKNIKPSYSLYQLLDVEVVDPHNQADSEEQNNKVLYYDHNSAKFKTRPRTNVITELDDVEIGEPTNDFKILTLDEDRVWRDLDLKIERDPAPTLGNHLNAFGFSILNSSYRIQEVDADAPIVPLNTSTADYFIIKGVPSEDCEQCLIDITCMPRDNTISVVMFEVRQDTGSIVLSGLQNVHYEDGKPILLSGAGKTDLITVTVRKIEGEEEYTSYVTAAALNMAKLGEGGTEAFRYDKNRYPPSQSFDTAKLYDDWFKYVQLLLNFEARPSKDKLWYEDKSIYEQDVTTTAIEKTIPVYNFGIQESVAEFQSYSASLDIVASSPIVLDEDFTFEFFVRYPLDGDFISASSITHTYFSNGTDFYLKYHGQIDSTNQDTVIELNIGTHTYFFSNAYRYFQYQNNRYIHVAIVRDGLDIKVYINGIIQEPDDYEQDDPVTSLSITNANIGIKGYINSLRITKGIVRYSSNFIPPAMRFGLLGGREGILEKQIYDTFYNMGELDGTDEDFIAHQLFC